MGKFHKRFAFRVEIDGIEQAAFRSAAGLEGNVAEVEEFEGGSLSPTKENGRTTYGNVTLSHGVTDNEELWNWFKSAAIGDDDAAEKDFAIVQLTRAGDEIKRWNCFSGKPRRFLAGEWDALTDDNTVEELEISIESFEPA